MLVTSWVMGVLNPGSVAKQIGIQVLMKAPRDGGFLLSGRGERTIATQCLTHDVADGELSCRCHLKQVSALVIGHPQKCEPI